jgi:hypothetical protein
MWLSAGHLRTVVRGPRPGPTLSPRLSRTPTLHCCLHVICIRWRRPRDRNSLTLWVDSDSTSTPHTRLVSWGLEQPMRHMYIVFLIV